MSLHVALRTPCCQRSVDGAYGYRQATQVVLRICPACHSRYAVKLVPLRDLREPGVRVHRAEWRLRQDGRK